MPVEAEVPVKYSTTGQQILKAGTANIPQLKLHQHTIQMTESPICDVGFVEISISTDSVES